MDSQKTAQQSKPKALSEKLNFALQTIHVIMNMIFPVIAYALLFVPRFPEAYEAGYANLIFVIGMVLYFLFILIIDMENFPKNNLMAIALILSPLITAGTIFFRGGDELGFYFSEVGVNMFLAIMIAGVGILMVGPLLSGRGWRGERSFLKDFDFVWQGLLPLIIPTVIVGIVLTWLFVESMIMNNSGMDLYIVIGNWGIGFLGALVPYYRYLFKASIYGDYSSK